MPCPITWLPRWTRSAAPSPTRSGRTMTAAISRSSPAPPKNLLRCCPVRIGTSHLIERDVRGGEILERLLLCLRATSLLLRATLTPLEVHARCQREMLETKRRGVPNGAANSVKLTETANTVDSLAVQVECLGRPANIQAWLR
jgi:hypothetical protein